MRRTKKFSRKKDKGNVKHNDNYIDRVRDRFAGSDRAITPVIATLLMIAITVAAVAGFYIFYRSFIAQSSVSAAEPGITVMGPSTADPGDTVVITVKNTGNIDMTELTVTVSTDLTKNEDIDITTTDPPLTPGSQVTTTVTIDPTTALTEWSITAKAKTKSGSQASDIWVIEAN